MSCCGCLGEGGPGGRRFKKEEAVFNLDRVEKVLEGGESWGVHENKLSWKKILSY